MLNVIDPTKQSGSDPAKKQLGLGQAKSTFKQVPQKVVLPTGQSPYHDIDMHSRVLNLPYV